MFESFAFQSFILLQKAIHGDVREKYYHCPIADGIYRIGGTFTYPAPPSMNIAVHAAILELTVKEYVETGKHVCSVLNDCLLILRRHECSQLIHFTSRHITSSSLTSFFMLGASIFALVLEAMT